MTLFDGIKQMEVLWTTLIVCGPIIVVGTLLFLCLQRVSALWRQKFLPCPFTTQDRVLTTVSLGYSSFVLVVISFSDPFARGVLYLGSVLLGTLALAIVRSRFRSFYTLLFTVPLFLGSAVGVFMHQRELGEPFDKDLVITVGFVFAFLVLLPTAITWIVTLFRNEKDSF
jgi:hypothetical protein